MIYYKVVVMQLCSRSRHRLPPCSLPGSGRGWSHGAGTPQTSRQLAPMTAGKQDGEGRPIPDKEFPLLNKGSPLLNKGLPILNKGLPLLNKGFSLLYREIHDKGKSLTLGSLIHGERDRRLLVRADLALAADVADQGGPACMYNLCIYICMYVCNRKVCRILY